MDKLRVARANGKRAFTRINRNLLKQIADEAEPGLVQDCWKELQEAWSDVESKHNEYVSLLTSEEEMDGEEPWISEVYDSFSNSKKTFFNFMKNCSKAVKEEQTSVDTASIKRPDIQKLKMPLFSGSQDNVISFNDFLNMFDDLIGNNSAYSNTAKLMYLKSYLRGNALDIIKHLSNDEKSYELARVFLKEEYLDNDIVVEEHIRRLHELTPPPAKDFTALRSFFNTARTSVYELKAFGFDALQDDTLGSKIVSYMICQKLPTNFKSKLSTTLQTDFPSTRELLENYNTIIKSLMKTSTPAKQQEVNNGEICERVRCMIDFGSQASYISEDLAARLGFNSNSPTTEYNVKTCIGVKKQSYSSATCDVIFTPTATARHSFLVDPDMNLDYDIPGVKSLVHKLKTDGVRLADSFFNDITSDTIGDFDCLLGSDVIGALKPLRSVDLGLGTALEVQDGHILFGDIDSFYSGGSQEGVAEHEDSTDEHQEDRHDTSAPAGDDEADAGSHPQTLFNIYNNSRQIMMEGGFNLRSWMSNHPQLVDIMASEDTIHQHDAPVEKVLGYFYDSKQDVVSLADFSFEERPQGITKRQLLSNISKVFDPLSLALPVTIRGRLLMKQVWKDGTAWDEEVTPEVYRDWKLLKNDLNSLREIKFPRKTGDTEIGQPTELHLFCDGSKACYGFACYVKQENSEPQLPIININDFSSLKRLYGVTAMVFQFINKLKHRQADAREQAKVYWLKTMQEESFVTEISYLQAREKGKTTKSTMTAYIGYVRALFDYGAAVVGTHAAPTVRERLEAEQNKCARLITGCIRLTCTDALLAEADLPPLSLRAKQLAGLERQRLARLPALDPARTLLEKELQWGPAGQVTALAADIWKGLHTLSERGTTLTFQWAPGHAGLEGNEYADQLAGEATAAEQPDVPIDLASARSAIGRRIGTMVDARTTAFHPHPAPTPGHNDLSRWEACTLSQLRTGASPLTRDVVHRLGLAADATCPACGEPDSAAHLLTECPAYEAARRRRWGLDPSLGDVLGGPATVVDYIVAGPPAVDP
ncbi:hypothetical protein FJT64_013671 [Amphibalanus amphitrite]|uniref:Uncharacterized protein n=1 Tax=Amphibalanus amphitrite TaxID=1232801 RepID=A0A6A4V2V8_AMPAM|nr:hypothetical protein FJT64_013671 [Amphibalanus amphitrite]